MTELFGDPFNFDFKAVTPSMVERALTKETLALEDLGALLAPAAEPYLEAMAVKAQDLTRRFFGLNIALYTPLYLANYCQNQCLYCGYSQLNNIKRGVLTPKEIQKELTAIKKTGLKDVLLLTGESRVKSGPDFINAAVSQAAADFPSVGLEVYPFTTEEYAAAKAAGADYVCLYQETYDPVLYDRIHPKGPKKDYNWRLFGPERALEAGIRQVGLGALLGLGDFRPDVLALGAHGQYLSQKFPAAEIAYSTPRLRPASGIQPLGAVSEKELGQIIFALRIFSPSFGISLSTRERAFYRDNLIGLGVTRLSAGVKTTVGGHDGEANGSEQFAKSDDRGVTEVQKAIAAKGHQPVFTDYARL
ncbi:MAG: 2-iminoacetate synthase ThiH [Deltaproteobacteria bacterium]|jgi:2-iminoacetate synthase|nr:2-iminoacetate synthase ThiH [Deltaproteobacteria bacterium]